MSDHASAPPDRPAGSTHHLQLHLAARPSSAATARRQVVAALGRWGWQECAETAALLVSELVANAVRHGRGPVDLRLSAQQDALVVRVIDASPQPPCPAGSGSAHPDGTHPDSSHPNNTDPNNTDPGSTEHLGERGRGLLLVEALATAWGWTAHPGAGKEVWFRLDRDPSSSGRPAPGQNG